MAGTVLACLAWGYLFYWRVVVGRLTGATTTVEFGYAISSEEHLPNDLVEQSKRAEEAGFTVSLISGHYDPKIDAWGHSPFVWSVFGGISHTTSSLWLSTGVTFPKLRIHAAIVAQAK